MRLPEMLASVKRFHKDARGAMQTLEFLLVMIAIVAPLIALMQGLLHRALVELEGLTMTLLASPFF